MRNSNQCERATAHSAMSPGNTSALMLAVLLLSFIPITTSAPMLLNPSSLEHEQLLTQTSDVLEDLCFLMLGSLQKSKEITARETSKRENLQGPGRIQSRGYFLYRPRNGRRSDEYV
ncbi:neuromedin-U isoform X5 [Danio rerio]|uniref:Neuromedin-U isoform X5 n=1 Tax=Danio rerio TaxID=7955 RepID=A0AC58I2I1_DANRE